MIIRKKSLLTKQGNNVGPAQGHMGAYDMHITQFKEIILDQSTGQF